MDLIGLALSLIGAFTLGGWAVRAWDAIADRLEARRKRLAVERATWAESVTKQTKPPPVSGPIVIVGEAFRDCTPRQRADRAKELVDKTRADTAKSDPSLPARLAFAKSPEGRDKARQSIAAEKVRRATKRRK